MYIKYWHRLAQTNSSQTLLFNAFTYSNEIDSSWWKGMKRLVKLADININQAGFRDVNFVLKAVVNVCKTSFIEGWKNVLGLRAARLVVLGAIL